ncbi:hypothetical protein [Curtobacterium sp. MEB011]|uniref:hypothetical protein n=1 Tax=Curtobacterium sp. MEB011 TaxID=3040285 RepID=UPI00254DEE82|nr:hypothetical protein [Curtobacterium sp. MEB011]
MTALAPARLDRFSVPSLALMQVRKDARALADRRWKAVEARLREDGAGDRAVLGIPDSVVVKPWRPANEGQAWGALAAAWNNAFEQLARDFAIGFGQVRR